MLRHKGDFMDNVCAACEPAEPKLTRIMDIYEQLRVLRSEVVELQRVVDKNRTKYFGSPGVSADKEKSKGGIVNDIDCMIDDIKQMVLDVRKYVETL